jgi:hypothetical protein
VDDVSHVRRGVADVAARERLQSLLPQLQPLRPCANTGCRPATPVPADYSPPWTSKWLHSTECASTQHRGIQQRPNRNEL